MGCLVTKGHLSSAASGSSTTWPCEAMSRPLTSSSSACVGTPTTWVCWLSRSMSGPARLWAISLRPSATLVSSELHSTWRRPVRETSQPPPTNQGACSLELDNDHIVGDTLRLVRAKARSEDAGLLEETSLVIVTPARQLAFRK